MTITTFQQTALPELGITVTEISQDIIVGKFENFAQACHELTDYKKMMNFRTLKNYYNEGLTPTQAVKKYFL